MSEFDEKLLNRLHLVEREIERLKRWEHKSKTEFDAEYLGLTAQAADSHTVDGAHASATPTATTIPIADAAGKLDVGWMPVGQTFVPLTTPLTSTAWDGDAFSTTAKTLIDLSTVFGVPAGVKAVLMQVFCRDSGSAASTTIYFALSPNDTAGTGSLFAVGRGIPNDTPVYATAAIPCDANGDIYYQVVASGVGTMDCWVYIWGYWL